MTAPDIVALRGLAEAAFDITAPLGVLRERVCTFYTAVTPLSTIALLDRLEAAEKDVARLNWIEDRSDLGPIEITLGPGKRPITDATYVSFWTGEGQKLSSGPQRHTRAAIDAAIATKGPQ